MNVLVDTNILVRLSDAGCPSHFDCDRAVSFLLGRGDMLFFCAQVTIEYWAVATRPRAANGLDFEPAEAEIELRDFDNMLILLPEPPDIAARWRALVNEHTVRGKQAHDARLVALMEAHGLAHLLTLNGSDFARYPGITSLNPADLK